MYRALQKDHAKAGEMRRCTVGALPLRGLDAGVRGKHLRSRSGLGPGFLQPGFYVLVHVGRFLESHAV
jgi:hypothetical protein